MSWQVIEADCVEAMREMDEASVDAVVTDPPYGLEFMGKEWDRLGEVTRAKRGAIHNMVNPDGSQKFKNEMPAFDLGASANRRMQEWHQAWATEALRVLRPGGHLLAFGGTRTSHRLACAIEDAGFEIRDSVIWLYGSGFPKSLDVGKAIDKAAGAEGEYGAPKSAAHAGWIDRGAMRGEEGHEGYQRPWMQDGEAVDRNARQYEPATPEAQRWQGWGTALKPAHEPIVVARKPLIGTVAQNVERFGTGALNIDGCRIEGDTSEFFSGTGKPRSGMGHAEGYGMGDGYGGENANPPHPSGRWPANVALSHLPECQRVGERRVKGIPKGSGSSVPGALGRMNDDGWKPKPRQRESYADPDGLETVEAWSCVEGCPVRELDLQSGELKSGFMAAGVPYPGGNVYGAPSGTTKMDTYGDTGGASRFFYVAKASRAERNAGLEGFEERARGDLAQGMQNMPLHGTTGKPTQRTTHVLNSHPTVKPVDLMRWLVRLVTPPDGLVLDPFAGSGTTGIACVLEDFDFIGIERDSSYVEIARARIDYWAKQPKQLDLLGDAA